MGKVTFTTYPLKSADQANWPFEDEEDTEMVVLRNSSILSTINEAWIDSSFRALYMIQFCFMNMTNACLCICHHNQYNQEWYSRIILAPEEKQVCVYVKEALSENNSIITSNKKDLETQLISAMIANKHVLILVSKERMRLLMKEMKIPNQVENCVFSVGWEDGCWLSSTTTKSG